MGLVEAVASFDPLRFLADGRLIRTFHAKGNVMITFEGQCADEVWRMAAAELRVSGAHQESRDQPTLELLHAAFTIHDPRQRIVFARPINPAFAIAEVIWILSGANDSGFLRFWNPRMVRYTDADESRMHGAYGFRLGSQPRLPLEIVHRLRHEDAPGSTRLDQIRAAYEAFRHDPDSRQVVLGIWDSECDFPNPEPRSKDVPCNLVSHPLVRTGKLEWLQVLRSNDLFWGVPYNFIQFTTIQEIMAGWLGLDVGTYVQISDSLHAYKRHWEDLNHVVAKEAKIPRNDADLRVGPYEVWERLWVEVVDRAIRLTKYTTSKGLLHVADDVVGLPAPYAEWIALLAAEALRRRGYVTTALEVIERAGPFWGESWRRWAGLDV